MKKALILGCSHALGSEMYKEPGFQLPSDYLYNDEYGADNSYPVQIAQQLGYTALNHAIAGGSNDAMYRIFSEQLDRLSSADTVIACWTGANRGEVFYEHENRWLPVSPGDPHVNQIEPNSTMLQGKCILPRIKHYTEFENYERQWTLYQSNQGYHNKIKNILALNMLAQAQSIPVINIDSFWPVSYLWPATINWAVPDWDFTKFCDVKLFPKTTRGHYFRPAHEAFAKYVLTNLAG